MLTAQQKKTRFKTVPLFNQQYLSVELDKGIVHDVSVCSVGEAKGHDIFLDQSFINDVVRFGNEFKQGLKCRFGHPSLSSEALGTYLGRFKNFRSKGEKAIADLYLDDVAKQSPGGDLYTWLLSMAAKNPDQFGASLVFEPGKSYQVIDGQKDYNCPLEGQPVYASIETLCGLDMVDEPAANDAGLFSSMNFNADKFAVRISSFLDDNPDIWAFIDQHPEKFQPFFKRYSAYKTGSKKPVQKNIAMTTKKHKSFFEKLAAAFQKDDANDIALAQIDAVTDGGENIRVDAASDAPAVGDAVYIVDPATDQTTVAPDNDYTIAGGDYDGYKLTVVNGVISAVFNPADQTTQVQQSAIKNYTQLQAENKNMKGQLAALQNSFKGLQAQFEAYKKTPLAEHTTVIPDENSNGNTADNDEQFYNKPWNKKAKKAVA